MSKLQPQVAIAVASPMQCLGGALTADTPNTFFPLCSPDVALAASSRPHPSNDYINIRIQTTGEVSAVQALGKACEDLSNLCDHMETVFEQAVQEFEASQPKDAEMEDGS